jgi:hypothetical protein
MLLKSTAKQVRKGRSEAGNRETVSNFACDSSSNTNQQFFLLDLAGSDIS